MQLSCCRLCSLPVVLQGLGAAGEAARTALRMFQLAWLQRSPYHRCGILSPRALLYGALPTSAPSALRHAKSTAPEAHYMMCCPPLGATPPPPAS